MFCSDPSTDTYLHQELVFNIYSLVMEILMAVLILAGVYILFIKHRHLVKPNLIKVLWATFCLINLARLLCSLVYKTYISKRDSFDTLDERDDWEKNSSEAKALNRATLTLAAIYVNATMAAHWMLSINYFDLAIKCQLFIEHNRIDIERIGRQFKIKDRQVLTLNAIFYSFFAINTFLCLYYPKHMAIFASAQVFGMMLAAAVMVYSIYLLKRKIRSLGQGKIKAREKLMSALSNVFIFQIALVCC